jgi:hypothetical protein
VDEAGQVYFVLASSSYEPPPGSAACSGAIFSIPAAFGHTNPELSAAALERLLFPIIAIAGKKYRLSAWRRQDAFDMSDGMEHHALRSNVIT